MRWLTGCGTHQKSKEPEMFERGRRETECVLRACVCFSERTLFPSNWQPVCMLINEAFNNSRGSSLCVAARPSSPLSTPIQESAVPQYLQPFGLPVLHRSGNINISCYSCMQTQRAVYPEIFFCLNNSSADSMGHTGMQGCRTFGPV